MSATGTGAPQFLLTHYISIIYKTQTFHLEEFVFCIYLITKTLTEIAAQSPAWPEPRAGARRWPEGK